MAQRPVSVPSAVLRAGAAGPGLSIAGRLGAWLDRQSPWRRRVIAFLLGALAGTALDTEGLETLHGAIASLAPAYALPALIISFSGLVLLTDRTPRPLAAVA